MDSQLAYPLIDVSLSRRLERAEGAANAGSVEARARLDPSSGASWAEIAGTYAMFDGPDSPMTQTFGLGLFHDGTGPAELAAIERFFVERGAGVCHEVSPIITADLVALLNQRGYKPIEFTNLLFRPVGSAGPAAASTVRVRVVGEAEQEAWTRTAAEGWSESPEVAGFMRDIGALTMATADAVCFLAEIAGMPVGTAILRVHEGVALLAGASTIPPARGQGAQQALLHARLRVAAERGCDIAMMGAAPGSASQRNAERHGFRVAYTRIKWGRGRAQ
jgi:GNAT superfamily N-acetyltransferase